MGIDVREIGWEGVDGVCLTWNRALQQALLNIVMNLCDP
jgi:hypothetical protein